MRLRIKKVLGYSFTLLGILLALAAISAELLGLDRDVGWGPARFLLLIVGFALVVLANVGDLSRYLVRPRHRQRGEELDVISAKAVTSIRPLSTIGGGSEQPQHRDRILSLYLLVIFSISVVTLTWLISFGRWKPWQQTTDYYHLLAEGLRAGETHLLVEPDQKLLKIDNPYMVANRNDVPYLWDVSLFNGKYFLYWGPAPAIFLIGLEMISPSPIGDHELVWFFTVLTVLFTMLILRLFWREVFPQLSAASVVPVALAGAFINPLLWLVSRPAVYEAAVSGGQACFIGGVFCLAPLFWRSRVHGGRIILGSTFWVLAVASRISLVFAVTLLPIGLVVFLVSSSRRSGISRRTVLAHLGYLLVPLTLGALLLAWYNYDRFGSIFELGHRYQLGQLNIKDNYNSVASLEFVPVNLYNYFLNIPGWLNVFPYLKPAWGQYAVPALRYTAPENYYTEQVTGILIASPVVALGLLPVVGWLRSYWHNIDLRADERIPTPSPFVGSPFGSLYTGLICTLILLSLPIMAVSFNSMRHEFDIVPTIFLCAVLGYGFALQRTSNRPIPHRLLLAVTWLAVFWTITMSMLLSFTGYASKFESINPALFDKLTRLFTW